MTSELMCKKPDRDIPGIVCGHPLPCPYHTIVVDTTTKPIHLAHARPVSMRTQRRLFAIADALKKD